MMAVYLTGLVAGRGDLPGLGEQARLQPHRSDRSSVQQQYRGQHQPGNSAGDFRSVSWHFQRVHSRRRLVTRSLRPPNYIFSSTTGSSRWVTVDTSHEIPGEPAAWSDRKLKLAQNGNSVTGELGSNISIWGRMMGNQVKFEYMNRSAIGEGEWLFDARRSAASGTWKPGSTNARTSNTPNLWNLTRIE